MPETWSMLAVVVAGGGAGGFRPGAFGFRLQHDRAERVGLGAVAADRRAARGVRRAAGPDASFIRCAAASTQAHRAAGVRRRARRADRRIRSCTMSIRCASGSRSERS